MDFADILRETLEDATALLHSDRYHREEVSSIIEELRKERDKIKREMKKQRKQYTELLEEATSVDKSKRTKLTLQAKFTKQTEKKKKNKFAQYTWALQALLAVRQVHEEVESLNLSSFEKFSNLAEKHAESNRIRSEIAGVGHRDMANEELTFDNLFEQLDNKITKSDEQTSADTVAILSIVGKEDRKLRLFVDEQVAIYRDPENHEIVARKAEEETPLGISDNTVPRRKDGQPPVVLEPREHCIEVQNRRSHNSITIERNDGRTEISEGQTETVSNTTKIEVGYQTTLVMQVKKEARINVEGTVSGDVVEVDQTNFDDRTQVDDSVVNRSDIGEVCDTTADDSADKDTGTPQTEYCMFCGAEITAAASFCPQCGTDLSGTIPNEQQEDNDKNEDDAETQSTEGNVECRDLEHEQDVKDIEHLMDLKKTKSMDGLDVDEREQEIQSEIMERMATFGIEMDDLQEIQDALDIPVIDENQVGGQEEVQDTNIFTGNKKGTQHTETYINKTAETTDTIFCRCCGTEAPENAIFCGNCGEQLSTEEEPTQTDSDMHSIDGDTISIVTIDEHPQELIKFIPEEEQQESPVLHLELRSADYTARWTHTVPIDRFLQIVEEITGKQTAEQQAWCFFQTNETSGERIAAPLETIRDDERFPNDCGRLTLEMSDHELSWEESAIENPERYEATVRVNSFDPGPVSLYYKHLMMGILRFNMHAEVLGRSAEVIETAQSNSGNNLEENH